MELANPKQVLTLILITLKAKIKIYKDIKVSKNLNSKQEKFLLKKVHLLLIFSLNNFIYLKNNMYRQKK